MAWIKPHLETKWAVSERALRWVLAGPVALLLSILLMASLPLVLPAGAGGVNHLVLPVLAFPLIWAILIVLAVAARNVWRLTRIYAGAFLACLLLIGGTLAV